MQKCDPDDQVIQILDCRRDRDAASAGLRMETEDTELDVRAQLHITEMRNEGEDADFCWGYRENVSSC